MRRGKSLCQFDATGVFHRFLWVDTEIGRNSPLNEPAAAAILNSMKSIPAIKGGLSRSFLLAWLFIAIEVVPGMAAESGNIIDLQPWRSAVTDSQTGKPGYSITLINLNPDINAWYLFQYGKPGGAIESYHLENAFPESQWLEIDDQSRLIAVMDSSADPCVLWQAGDSLLLANARMAKRPFVDLCDGRVYLRNKTEGRRTRKEWVADMLRDRVRYGEQITNFIKEKFFRDKYRRTGQRAENVSNSEVLESQSKPTAIRTASGARTITLTSDDLNLVTAFEPGGGLRPGHWYTIPGYPGVFLSVVTPELILFDTSMIARGLLSPVQDKEQSALIYLVAFDLSLFDLGFALGTDHPRVGWSDRVPESSRNPQLPGPDGFDTVEPLVRTGKINPRQVSNVAATFAGGFKRAHGAFKWGDLATENYGSHYGFIENGVVFSTLQPGLATLIVCDDGYVDMETWTTADDEFLPQIRYARQNGIPLIEPDSLTGKTRPGESVTDWAKGNWSGSESKELRTLRAGVGIQETADTRFLIYAYFSAATPSTMARVFYACNCTYAMHLDMNAPEHTYLALYRVEGGQFVVQRLVKEMAEVDPPVDAVELPRFVGYSDNRDFFYLLRKEQKE